MKALKRVQTVQRRRITCSRSPGTLSYDNHVGGSVQRFVICSPPPFHSRHIHKPFVSNFRCSRMRTTRCCHCTSTTALTARASFGMGPILTIISAAINRYTYACAQCFIHENSMFGHNNWPNTQWVVQTPILTGKFPMSGCYYKLLYVLSQFARMAFECSLREKRHQPQACMAA